MHGVFFIRHDNQYVRLSLQEILYLEARKNYVHIVTTKEKYLVLISLQQLEDELPSTLFCRVHRSYIVSLEHVVSFDNNYVRVARKVIPISEQFRNMLPSQVKILRSNTRNIKNTLLQKRIAC